MSGLILYSKSLSCGTWNDFVLGRIFLPILLYSLNGQFSSPSQMIVIATEEQFQRCCRKDQTLFTTLGFQGQKFPRRAEKLNLMFKLHAFLFNLFDHLIES